MEQKEWSQLWHYGPLDVTLLSARYVAHAYPRHSHDYYVVALVDQGVQSFSSGGRKYVTPAGGLILLNPGEAHTGEPLDKNGFQYRAFYPTAAHMEMALSELSGRHAAAPLFAAPRLDQPRLARAISRLHSALTADHGALESESRFLWTLVELIRQAGDKTPTAQKIGQEQQAIQRACNYLQANYAQSIALAELANHVHLSPYHLLRTFRNAVGMPPHSYQTSVRIRHAQRLLAAGQSLTEAAHAVGFSSQGHFSQRFKQIIGVTPGQYAAQVRGEV